MARLSRHTCQKHVMLSGKQRETSMSEDALIVITSAIKTAFIDHPSSGHGTTWDQVTKSDEESLHLAEMCWLLFTKPDIRLPGSRTRMRRRPKGEKLLPT